MDLKEHIRDIPDFPKPGILFRDITPLLASPEAFQFASQHATDYQFVYVGDLDTELPSNCTHAVLGPNLSFSDLVNVSNVVISKLGYGMLASCVATHTDLLFPPRSGFREDEILNPAAERFTRSKRLPLEDFSSGDWKSHLDALHELPRPSDVLEINGADYCARLLIDGVD